MKRYLWRDTNGNYDIALSPDSRSEGKRRMSPGNASLVGLPEIEPDSGPVEIDIPEIRVTQPAETDWLAEAARSLREDHDEEEAAAVVEQAAGQIVDLTKRLNKRIAMASTIEAERNQLKAELDRVREELDGMAGIERDLRAKLLGVIAERDGLRREITKAREELAEAEKLAKSRFDQWNTLGAECAGLQKQLAEAREQIAEFKTQQKPDWLRESRDEAITRQKATCAELDQLKAELAEANRAKQSQVEVILVHSRKVEALEKELAEAHAHQEVMARTHIEEANKLAQERDDARNRVADLEAHWAHRPGMTIWQLNVLRRASDRAVTHETTFAIRAAIALAEWANAEFAGDVGTGCKTQPSGAEAAPPPGELKPCPGCEEREKRIADLESQWAKRPKFDDWKSEMQSATPEMDAENTKVFQSGFHASMAYVCRVSKGSCFCGCHTSEVMAPAEQPQKPCEFCSGVESYCGEEDPKGELVCTRLVGHDGDHVACGFTSHSVARWPQETRRCPVCEEVDCPLDPTLKGSGK